MSETSQTGETRETSETNDTDGAHRMHAVYVMKYLWFVAGIVCIAFAAVRFATGDETQWAYPILVGGVACILGGLYQTWWEKAVFSEDDERSPRFPAWLLRPPHGARGRS